MFAYRFILQKSTKKLEELFDPLFSIAEGMLQFGDNWKLLTSPSTFCFDILLS